MPRPKPKAKRKPRTWTRWALIGRGQLSNFVVKRREVLLVWALSGERVARVRITEVL